MSERKEEWRDIEGFPDYQVSNLGRIRSHKTGKWHFLKLRVRDGGYKQVYLYRDGKSSTKRVHRLVLEAFVGPCPPGMETCHGDGNPSNNHLSNLRWDTHSSNIQDAMRHGTSLIGTANPSAKLTNREVFEIRKLRSEGMRLKDLAKRFEMSLASISGIVVGKNWSHLPGPLTVVGQARGERHGNSKLSAEEVREIRRLRQKERMSLQDLAEKFGVSRPTISEIANRKIWKHIK